MVSTNHSRKLTGAQEVAVSVKVCKLTLRCQEFSTKTRLDRTHP